MTPDQIAYATGPALDALWPVLLVCSLLCGIAGALIAPSRGQVSWKWLAISCVFGLPALAVLSCLPVKRALAPAAARDTASPHTLRRIGD